MKHTHRTHMWFKEVLRIWGEYAFLAGKGRDGGAFWENMCLLRRGGGGGEHLCKSKWLHRRRMGLRRTDWGRIVLGQRLLGQRRRELCWGRGPGPGSWLLRNKLLPHSPPQGRAQAWCSLSRQRVLAQGRQAAGMGASPARIPARPPAPLTGG